MVEIIAVTLGHLCLELVEVWFRGADGDIEEAIIVGHGKSRWRLGRLAGSEFCEPLLPLRPLPDRIVEFSIQRWRLLHPLSGDWCWWRGVKREAGSKVREGGKDGEAALFHGVFINLAIILR